MRIKLAALIALLCANAVQAQPPYQRRPPRAAPPPPVYQPPAPVRVAPVFLDEDDLEEYVEVQIKRAFRRLVDDIDVDVDRRRGEIEIEFEVCNRQVAFQVKQFVASLPEVQGWRLRFDIDYD